jgi:hypothetical protein
LDEVVDVALMPGGGDVGVVEEHGAVVFPSERWLDYLRVGVLEFGVCCLLCCIPITAPSFTDLSYFEALEGFFVEVVAFCVVA